MSLSYTGYDLETSNNKPLPSARHAIAGVMVADAALLAASRTRCACVSSRTCASLSDCSEPKFEADDERSACRRCSATAEGAASTRELATSVAGSEYDPPMPFDTVIGSRVHVPVQSPSLPANADELASVSDVAMPVVGSVVVMTPAE